MADLPGAAVADPELDVRRPSPVAERETATFARSGGAMVVSFFLQAALQFALVLVVTRALDAGGAGAFFEGLALFMIVTRWGALGADSGIVRAVPRLRVLGRSGELGTTIAVAVVPVAVVGVVAAVCVYAAADSLAGAFFDAGHRDVGAHELRLLAAFIPIWLCATVLLAAVRGFGDITFYAVQNAAVAAVRPPIVAAVAVAGLGAAGVTVGWALPTIAALAGAIVLLRRHLRRVDSTTAEPRRPLGAVIPEFWAYSLPRALAAVFTVTITWLDVLLVGRLSSTAEAGVYGVASRLYVVGAYALQAVGTAAAPQFSELIAAGRRRELERVYQLGTWWTMAISWPFYALMLVFPMTMMEAFFGSQYSGGGHALAVLGFAGLLDVGTGNSQAVLLMSGHSRFYAANTAAALAANVGLNLALVPRFGITGAAVAWAVSIAITNLAALLQVRYVMGVRPFGRGYPLIAAATLVCFAGVPLVVRTAAGSGLPAFAASIALASLCYLAALRRLRADLELGTLWRAFRPAQSGAAKWTERTTPGEDSR